jgi:hypothetical protein
MKTHAKWLSSYPTIDSLINYSEVSSEYDSPNNFKLSSKYTPSLAQKDTILMPMVNSKLGLTQITTIIPNYKTEAHIDQLSGHLYLDSSPRGNPYINDIHGTTMHGSTLLRKTKFRNRIRDMALVNKDDRKKLSNSKPSLTLSQSFNATLPIELSKKALVTIAKKDILIYDMRIVETGAMLQVQLIL